MENKQKLGITLPIRRGKDGYFESSSDIMVQSRSNLINLLLTKKGGRIMQPTFGCDIHRFLFQNITDNVMANIKSAIESAVEIWIPYLDIVDVKVESDELNHSISLSVTFSLNINPTVTDTVTVKF